MKSLCVLAVIGMVGCAVGQESPILGSDQRFFGNNPELICAAPKDTLRQQGRERYPKADSQCNKPYLAWQKPAKKDSSGILTLTGQTSCKVVPAGDGCNSCTVCESAMGTGSTCTLMFCAKMNEEILEWSGQTPTADPIDVPAIQETVKDAPNCSTSYIAGSQNDGWLDGYLCTSKQTYRKRWRCDDTDRALMESTSGRKHWCHREQP